MATYASQIASGSTNGRMIEIAATATPGTTLHTAVSGTSSMDEVYVWAMNHHTDDVLLTIEWGGVTSTDDLIEQYIPFDSGLHLVIPGFRIQNGLLVRAFAGTTNVISCAVNVNRITV